MNLRIFFLLILSSLPLVALLPPGQIATASLISPPRKQMAAWPVAAAPLPPAWEWRPISHLFLHSAAGVALSLPRPKFMAAFPPAAMARNARADAAYSRFMPWLATVGMSPVGGWRMATPPRRAGLASNLGVEAWGQRHAPATTDEAGKGFPTRWLAAAGVAIAMIGTVVMITGWH